MPEVHVSATENDQGEALLNFYSGGHFIQEVKLEDGAVARLIAQLATILRNRIQRRG